MISHKIFKTKSNSLESFFSPEVCSCCRFCIIFTTTKQRETGSIDHKTFCTFNQSFSKEYFQSANVSQLVEHIWAVNAWLIVFWWTPHWSAFEDEDGPSMTAIIHYLSPLISRITCSHLGPLGRLLPSVANPFPRTGCPILLMKTNTKNLTNLV